MARNDKYSVKGKRTHREIIRAVNAQGGDVREGKNHTQVGKDGQWISIPRHTGDLAVGTVSAITKFLILIGFGVLLMFLCMSVSCTANALAVDNLTSIPIRTPIPEPTESPMPPVYEFKIYLPIIFRFQLLDIINPGFELEQWQETAWCYGSCTILQHEQFQEIRPPGGWVAWWRDSNDLGRPEVGIVNLATDPIRVHSGKQASKWFTFWRAHYGGLAQQLPNGITLYLRTRTTYPLRQEDWYVDDVSAFFHPDGSVVVRLWMHGWYSDCKTRPYDGPYRKDCVTPYNAHQYLSVGVDFDGGEVDPRYPPLGPDIVWSNEVEQYGRYTFEPFTFVVNPNGS